MMKTKTIKLILNKKEQKSLSKLATFTECEKTLGIKIDLTLGIKRKRTKCVNCGNENAIEDNDEFGVSCTCSGYTFESSDGKEDYL